MRRIYLHVRYICPCARHEGIAPLILKLGTGRGSVVRNTIGQLYLLKEPPVPNEVNGLRKTETISPVGGGSSAPSLSVCPSCGSFTIQTEIIQQFFTIHLMTAAVDCV